MSLEKLQYLIKSCKKNNREAQAELFELYSEKMFAVCLCYSKNKSDAEDFLHTGFLKVFEKIKQYNGIGSFEGWLKKIFINTILEDYRKVKSQQQKIIEIQKADKLHNNDIYQNINSAEIIKCIQELSPGYRMVFNLYAIEGYCHEEISKMLGISKETSRSNLSRARSILKKKLKIHFQLEFDERKRTYR